MRERERERERDYKHQESPELKTSYFVDWRRQMVSLLIGSFPKPPYSLPFPVAAEFSSSTCGIKFFFHWLLLSMPCSWFGPVNFSWNFLGFVIFSFVLCSSSFSQIYISSSMQVYVRWVMIFFFSSKGKIYAFLGIWGIFSAGLTLVVLTIILNMCICFFF